MARLNPARRGADCWCPPAAESTATWPRALMPRAGPQKCPAVTRAQAVPSASGATPPAAVSSTRAGNWHSVNLLPAHCYSPRSSSQEQRPRWCRALSGSETFLPMVPFHLESSGFAAASADSRRTSALRGAVSASRRSTGTWIPRDFRGGRGRSTNSFPHLGASPGAASARRRLERSVPCPCPPPRRGWDIGTLGHWGFYHDPCSVSN